MKLTIVGGGGFRVPLVYGALLEKAERLGLQEVVLHDIDASRLERIGHVLDGLAAEHGTRLPFRATTDLVDAVEDADFVFCAIRVGQLEGRVVDEDVPLGLGVLGQETTGPGGICFALRTIPVMVRLAETIAKHAPNAWLINFTNPAGMVTEAVQQVLGDRAVGICDSPSGLCRRVAAAVGRDPGELWFDYFGLNHLGWLRGVREAGGDALLDGLLEDDERLASFEEGRLFGGEWLRSLGMIPNEYLYYFYYAADTVQAIRGSSALARRVPARAAARVLRPELTARGGGARRLARHAPRPRAHVHGRGAHRGGRRVRARSRRQRRLRERGDGRARGDRAQQPPGPDPQHRQPLEPAVPGRARGRRGAVRRRPRGSRADGDGPGTRARTGARGDDEGRRAHDDRRGAAGLARARDQGALAASAGPVGDHGAR